MICLHYQRQTITTKNPRLLRHDKPTECACGSYDQQESRQLSLVDTSLAFTSKQLYNECMPLLYRTGTIVWSCACELARDVAMNGHLRANLGSAAVRWVGPESDKAFAVLGRCRRLRHLQVRISEATTDHPTERERLMQSVHLSRSTRLCDALGIEELLRLRGLSSVSVRHVNRFWDIRRTEAERISLEVLLKAHCLQPREAGDDEDDDEFEMSDWDEAAEVDGGTKGGDDDDDTDSYISEIWD